jgi:hypothetical protein
LAVTIRGWNDVTQGPNLFHVFQHRVRKENVAGYRKSDAAASLILLILGILVSLSGLILLFQLFKMKDANLKEGATYKLIKSFTVPLIVIGVACIVAFFITTSG